MQLANHREPSRGTCRAQFSFMRARSLPLVKSVAVVLGLFGVGAGCSSAPSGEPIGSGESAVTASDKAAYDFFVGKGLKNYQAAGIVGNLDQESSMNPTVYQYGGGPGRGIAQWSAGGRWDTDRSDNAVWYASVHGEDVWTLNTQLEFIWYELTTFSGYGLAALRNSGSVTDATIVFETYYEGCGTCDQGNRISYAEAALAAYGASSPPASGGGGTTTCKGGATAVSRAEEWSNAELRYCWAPYEGYDTDPSCWPLEGPSHLCNRESNAAWNPYRSDCSGLVSWSWGLPPPGLTTLGFAPFSDSVTSVIPAESLQPGDAVNNSDHVMLFKGWVSVGHEATFIQEPGCSVNPPHAIESTYSVSISGTTINVPEIGMSFTAIRYNGNGCEGTGSSGGSSGASCYSETLGRDVADNTCVQSRYDGCNLSEINSTCNWYQCDNGSWVPRYTDTTACAATYPIGYTGTGSSGGRGCESETLRREVSDNACVQSDMNSEWYQCANGNWVDRWTDPTACNGVYPLHASANDGAGCHSDTLGRTMPDNACVESSSNDDWYQCDNGSWTDRWTDPAACNGVYPLR